MKKLLFFSIITITLCSCGPGRWVGGNEWKIHKREQVRAEKIKAFNNIKQTHS